MWDYCPFMYCQYCGGGYAQLTKDLIDSDRRIGFEMEFFALVLYGDSHSFSSRVSLMFDS